MENFSRGKEVTMQKLFTIIPKYCGFTFSTYLYVNSYTCKTACKQGVGRIFYSLSFCFWMTFTHTALPIWCIFVTVFETRSHSRAQDGLQSNPPVPALCMLTALPLPWSCHIYLLIFSLPWFSLFSHFSFLQTMCWETVENTRKGMCKGHGALVESSSRSMSSVQLFRHSRLKGVH